jgi:RNA polymerase sigma-70 factor (ECF subfamily)
LLWQKGNENAFNCLYERYVVYLINIALKKTNSLETAKDCVQDVFISIYHRKKFLKPATSLKAYLYKALQNKIYNFHIKELTRNQYEEVAAGQMNRLGDDVFENYNKKELQVMIEKVINQLPPQCRKVFLMSREDQLPYKEIATQLNISVNTVDQHIQKALRKLRSSLTLLIMLFCFFD